MADSHLTYLTRGIAPEIFKSFARHESELKSVNACVGEPLDRDGISNRDRLRASAGPRQPPVLRLSRQGLHGEPQSHLHAARLAGKTSRRSLPAHPCT